MKAMNQFFKSKCIVACMVVFGMVGVTLTSGCVSDKIITASNTCSVNQANVRIAELQAYGDKMDNKDIVIHMLAGKLAGDPCADILIAEINGKNKLSGIAIGAAAVVVPQYFSYKKDKALYDALTYGSNRTPANINITAETGNGGEGGGAGDMSIYTSVGNGGINTGTQTANDFDKGILGGEGSINDADTVNSDGLL